MKTWSNGKIIEGKVPIDSLNFVMHFASPCVWEGIRSYEQLDGTTKIFELRNHIERLIDSSKILGFKIPFSVDELMKGCDDVVAANGGGNLYLRPIAYSAQDAESVRAETKVVNVDIYCFPIKGLGAEKPEGIKVGISSYVRGYPQFQMQAKSPPNYASIQCVKQEMERGGFSDMLFTDNNGHITEATVANIFVAKGDVVFTPPNDGSILPGITRRNVAQILRNPLLVSSYKKSPIIMEKKITRADLYTADCVFMCGTYAEVVLISEIDGREIGNKASRIYYDIVKKEYEILTKGKKK